MDIECYFYEHPYVFRPEDPPEVVSRLRWSMYPAGAQRHGAIRHGWSC